MSTSISPSVTARLALTFVSIFLWAEHSSLVANAENLTSCGQLKVSAAAHEEGFNYILPFVDDGDSLESPRQSGVVVLENGVPLAGPHAQHVDIRAQGRGRYSHWTNALYFSTSDNSDPATNQKAYTYAVPAGEKCPTPQLAQTDTAKVADLSKYSQYGPPSPSVPAGTLEIVATEGPSYRAQGIGTILFSGENLMNDVLQPAMDWLAARGGGVLHLAGGNGKIYHLAGASARRSSSGQNLEVEWKSQVAILGDVNADGSPSTQIVLDSKLGNVFSGRSAHDLLMANISIEAKGLGNYVVSNFGCTNVLVQNVWINNPNWTAFGHISGVNNWYVNDRAFGKNPVQGHGFAIGGNEFKRDPKSGQDIGTTVINAVSTGFGDAAGGQGVQIRPVVSGAPYDSDVKKPNLHVRIIGGDFSKNRVGVMVEGATDPLLTEISSHDNEDYGIVVVAGYSTTEPKLTDADVHPQIKNAILTFNGHDVRTPMPTGALYVGGTNAVITGVHFFINKPYELILQGAGFSLTDNVFYNGNEDGTMGQQPYLMYLMPTADGSPITASLTGNHYCPTLYGAYDGGSPAGMTGETP